MQTTVSHPAYGLITYEESFWTGKKTIHKVLICIGISAAILAVGIPLLLAALAAQA